MVLHGGPGQGVRPAGDGHFDPGLNRVILFDQRGWRRSRPDASDPGVDLATKTTHDLLADIEALRHRLSIQK